MRKDNSIYNKKQPGLYIYLYLQSQIPTSCYSGKKTIRHFHGKISPYFRFSKKNIFSLQLFIFGLMLAMMFCTLVQGANRTVTENDGQGNKKRVIELRDTVINGETVTDTLSVMTYENGAGSSNAPEKWRTHHSSGMDWNGFDLGSKTSETVIAVTAIVFVFGLPLLIIFVVFFFRYKNRKAKYRLAEQALASGQQLPENFFKEAAATDIRSKGINNIFVGIGLFIFLWAITGEFGLGCIGLLVMFTGFGQLVIFYSQQKKNEEK